MTDTFSLSGKHVLVTGASSGIGKATAILCAQLGARLTVNGRNEERLAETLSLLEGEGHQSMVCDLSDAGRLEECVAGLDKLDGVVHCAGTLVTCLTKNVDEEVLQHLFSQNVYSVMKLNALLMTRKKLNRGASIVLVSSVSANDCAEVGNAVYGATKAALASYARVLALELSARKIRVNTVSPGMVRTPLLSRFDVTEEELAENEKKYPLGFGDPEDVAHAIAFLLGDGARWMTGSDIKLDGGLSLR